MKVIERSQTHRVDIDKGDDKDTKAHEKDGRFVCQGRHGGVTVPSAKWYSKYKGTIEKSPSSQSIVS